MKLNEKINQYLAEGCFFGLMIVAPLYYHFGYFDMIEAKAEVFRLVIYIVFMIEIVLAVAEVVRKRKITGIADFCALDYAMCVFAIAVFISWMSAKNKLAAFLGNQGWSTGALLLIGSVLCYFVISRYLPDNQNLWLPVLTVNVAIFCMVICNGMGKDTLSLHENIRPDQWYQYMSTLGQTNAVMGYIALVFPTFAIFFIASSQRSSAVLYSIVVVLGEMSVILCGSDGIYIAIGGCMFFLLPFVWKEKKRMIRFLEMMAAFGACIMVICKLEVFWDRLDHIEGMARFLIHMPIGEALCGGAVILAVAVIFLMEKHPKIWRAMLWGIEAGMGAGVMLVFVNTVKQYQKFENWGSGRKYLWEYSWNLFCGFSWKDKLFGVGPDMLGSYYEDCYEYFEETFLTAHSEFLQYLLTIGMVGAVAWIGICAAIVYTYFKYRTEETLTVAYFLPLAAYFMQAMIMNPQPLTLAVVCVILACFRRSVEKSRKNSTEK